MHQNYRGCWSGLWIAGKNFEGAIPKSNHPQRFKETFMKREKVFQVSENAAKIRFEFSGCYTKQLQSSNLY